jgi:hypothetical protein
MRIFHQSGTQDQAYLISSEKVNPQIQSEYLISFLPNLSIIDLNLEHIDIIITFASLDSE